MAKLDEAWLDSHPTPDPPLSLNSAVEDSHSIVAYESRIKEFCELENKKIHNVFLILKRVFF